MCKGWRCGSRIIVLVYYVIASSTAVLAHHGTNITYDQSKTVVLKGTVTAFKFANPHVEIHLEVKDQNGRIVDWTLEGTSVYYWSKAGWNKTSLKAGDQITAITNPARSGTATANIVKLVISNGKEFVTAQAEEQK
jgi:uncharacterized protein DUF6152